MANERDTSCGDAYLFAAAVPVHQIDVNADTQQVILRTRPCRNSNRLTSDLDRVKSTSTATYGQLSSLPRPR